jgi:cytochrome c biogenesis protein CcdA
LYGRATHDRPRAVGCCPQPGSALLATPSYKGCCFVAGFSTFVVGLFGFVGTLLGDVFYDVREAVRMVGGAVLIAFGLFKLRLLNLR